MHDASSSVYGIRYLDVGGIHSSCTLDDGYQVYSVGIVDAGGVLRHDDDT